MDQKVKVVQRKNGFMPNVRSGFTFLQLAIGLALMGILSYMVAPNLFRRVPRYERKEFVSALNSIAQQAWIRALTEGRVQKINFNFPKKQITIEEQLPGTDRQGKSVFKPVYLQFVTSPYTWPGQLEIQQFYIEGVDEIAQHQAGNKMQDVYFFVVPEGLAQSVIINIRDEKDITSSGDLKEIGLVLNPFKVQFESYEEFQHPSE